MYSTVFLMWVISGPAFYGCSQKTRENNSHSSQPELPDSGWVSMFNGKTLDNWEVTEFGTQGPVQVEEGNIILGMGEGCTGITWNGGFPKTNFEFKLEAKRVSGFDFFCGITFPAGNFYCSLIVGGWGGPVVGLSTIDGHDASENETRTMMSFETDVWYLIHLKVTDEKIEVWIDNKKVVDFYIGDHQLSIRPEVSLSTPFGICSWMTTAALRNMQLKYADKGNLSTF